ncbi:glutathione S-transferase N-terminal domain-containing protein [Lysobacter sp. MMG2]|uniref:glutathione S-transferase N-terminal domain-containing protein n=1 Tax=Lysobacter sp. MMG2 TaxID=2801338 RepID=UPI001C249AD0|nr:glutathione S-transferase N-terminal domain-containing protein [Lysobacter sp. MMG2]MBU8976976.1 glutathione S-transferase N-terminal domain-containing protein [Lysobacter sp. MMG2]
MIDLHYWPTPNGHKITIFLEEAGLPYTIHPVDIGAGDQFKPDYLTISPNNKMPAIVDREPGDGGPAISVFESGAILAYLANKTGKFVPADLRGRTEVSQWLHWQMGGLGPMTGQYGHFHVYAPEDLPYAKERYQREVLRLLGVLDRRLEGREFVAAGRLSIADMAIHPWINPYTKAPLDLTPFANLRRWHQAIAARPAVKRAYALAEKYGAKREMTPEMHKILFGTPSNPA